MLCMKRSEFLRQENFFVDLRQLRKMNFVPLVLLAHM